MSVTSAPVPPSPAPPLCPKVIPGCGNTHSNSGFPTVLSDVGFFAYQSASYGPQHLLACSSAVTNAGEIIFVYDMNSMLLTQSLSGHRATVTALLWRRPPASYLQTGLFLWSGDANGVLMYWDVVEGVALTSIHTPCQAPVQSLTLLTDDHLLVVTQASTSYVFNAHLVDSTPLPPGHLPLEVPQSSLLGSASRPSLVALSRLSDQHSCAVVLGDRLRIIASVQLESGAAAPVAKDLIYDSSDGAATVVDAFFSDAQEEVLYFATRNTVGCYDWRLGLMLNESLLWMPDEVEFRRIFRSSTNGTAACVSSAASAAAGGDAAPAAGRTPSPQPAAATASVQLPIMYSFGSDQRLVAWHVTRHDRFTSVATDVRGVRINAKLCVNVVQSELDSSRFAVLFEDGAIVHWEYVARTRRWRLMDCWLAPVVRPLTCCPVGVHHCCVALESGHLVVMDVTHSTAVRRFNLVYSGGTQMVLLCGYKWSDLVWVVSNRTQQARHHHQVSLIDTRTGEVVRVLRKPSSVPEQSRMKEIAMDPTTTYVLLAYWNGTFEVWTAEDSRLVHIHSGLGVANVSWAPASMRRCVSGVQGTPQLLAVLFSEGTLSLWSVYKDRVVVSRDAIPLLSRAAAQWTVRSGVVGNALVMWDGSGSGLALHAQGTRLAVRPLLDPPLGSGAVRHIAGPPPPSRAASGAEFVSFSSPLAWAASGSFAREGGEGDEAASPTAALPAGDFSAARAVAVLFENGVFAVWDVVTGERRALSTAGMASDVRALSLYWAGESLCVLGTDGSLYVFDPTLAEMNSSVRYRALRRPLKNVAFLLPAHRTYVQVSLELGSPCAAAGQDESLSSGNVAVAAAAPLRAPPSAVLDAVPVAARPCRGPFGQLITEDVCTLQEELELYRSTMVPRDVLRLLRRCGPAAGATWLRRAAVVAGFFGQATKQRFLCLAADVLSRWSPSALAPAGARRTTSATPSPADAALAAEAFLPPLRTNGTAPDDETGSVPETYAGADAYSEALAAPHVVRRNRILLNEQRTAALLVNTRSYRTGDDSVVRLALARDWLRLEQRQHVIEVLLDAPSQSSNYNELATLSMAVAASTAVTSSSADSATAALFVASAKRAAAMLLAQGEVEAAVEKLVLAGEYRSACVTLQSKGRWREAALLVKAVPQLQRPQMTEVLQRWSALSVQRGYRLLGAALLLASGGPAATGEAQPPPLAALSLLAESAHFTDVAGVLALALAQYHETILSWPDTALCSPVARTPDTSPSRPATPGAMTETVLHALGEYSSLLHTVGNSSAEAVVLRQAATVKATMRYAAQQDRAAAQD